METTVTRTVTEELECIGGKSYPITVTRLRSKEPFEFVHRGKTLLVDAVTITDSGRLGTSTICTLHRDFTQAQRQAGRKHIQDTIARVMVEQGIW